MTPSVLYRVYDDDGRLIYIGSTMAWPGREATHERASWWWSLAARIETDPFPNVWAARAAEAVAIQEEQPAFNAQHTGRAEGDWSHLTDNDRQVAREFLNTARAPYRRGVVLSVLGMRPARAAA